MERRQSERKSGGRPAQCRQGAGLQGEISTGRREIGTFCLRRDGRETYSGAMPWGLSAGITIYSEGVASVPQKGEEGRGVGSTGDW